MVRLRFSLPLFALVAGPAVGVIEVVELISDPVYAAPGWLVGLTAIWLTAGLLLQTVGPAIGLIAVAAFYPATIALGLPGMTGTGLIALLLACGYAGFRLAARISLIAVIATAVIIVITDGVAHGIGWDSLFFPLTFFPARWVGRLVSRERSRNAQLIELTQQLEAQRDAAEQAAVAAERTRIAREVHDSVAHSVSVMTLQTGGIRRQLAGVLVDHPQEREVLLGLERLGRQTVEELHGLVGILRDSSETVDTTVPSLARAADVISDVRAAGLEVEFSVRGEPAALPRALDLTAYRILQEALTNALRHAGAEPARVELTYGSDAIDLAVTNRIPAGSAARRPAVTV